MIATAFLGASKKALRSNPCSFTRYAPTVSLPLSFSPHSPIITVTLSLRNPVLRGLATLLTLNHATLFKRVHHHRNFFTVEMESTHNQVTHGSRRSPDVLVNLLEEFFLRTLTSVGKQSNRILSPFLDIVRSIENVLFLDSDDVAHRLLTDGAKNNADLQQTATQPIKCRERETLENRFIGGHEHICLELCAFVPSIICESSCDSLRNHHLLTTD